MDAKEIKFDGAMSSLEELAGAPAAFINASLDAAGAISARAGITTWSGFPSTFPSTYPVEMLAVVGDNLVYSTETDRKLFSWRASTGLVTAISTDVETTTIDGDLRPSYAVGRDLMVIAGGGAPQRVTVVGLTTARLGGSPSHWRDVAMVIQRTVGVRADDDGIFEWSDVGATGQETYDPSLEFLEAQAQPDILLAGRATSREYWAFGARTLQIHVPDEEETFAPQTTIEVGTVAMRSVIARESSFAFLDSNLRFIWLSGHVLDDAAIISAPGITRIVEQFSSVDDCWGYREKLGNSDSLVWVFPTEGRCLAFDTTTRTWSERYAWRGGNWRPYAPTAHVYWDARRLHIVGMSDGTLAQLSREAYTDLDDDLKWVARSGFNDHGLPLMKEPLELQIRMRRGAASSATSSLQTRWRDDLGAFCAPESIALGEPGDYSHTETVRPYGSTYRARQLELSGTAADAYSIAKVIETFEELDS